MEETYNEAAAFWQELKKELARAQAEKAAFLSTPGILEEDLDLSSEEEEEDDPLGELDGMIDDSDTESVAARRRCVAQYTYKCVCVGVKYRNADCVLVVVVVVVVQACMCVGG